MGSPKQTWTRDQVAARILAGDTLVICNKEVLRIPQIWLNAHPGGALAILHFNGRDATDEISAFHSEETLQKMKAYSIGPAQPSEDGWEPLVPPVMTGWVRKMGSDGKQEWFSEATVLPNDTISSDILLVERDSSLLQPQGPSFSNLIPPPTALSLKVQSEHSAAYKDLHKRIADAGLFKTRYIRGYGPEVLRYTLLAAGSAVAYSYSWLIVSSICLGLLWHQLVFSVHDLGHNGVTHDWTIDRASAIIIASFIGGLSANWWVDNHNTHHLVTNHPSHDPDIQHLPFIAVSPAFFNSLWSSYYKRTMIFDRWAKYLIPIQHKLFYVALSFGRFNLYALSYSFLYKKIWDTRKPKGARWTWWLEVIGIVVFWCWFIPVLRGCGSWYNALTYLLVSHWVTSPLHIQIVLSHFSMSTEDMGPVESFPARQLRTTTDVTCPPELSFVHGGLQLQVTHHLFPRLPRHNLREASALVKEFAKERGLVYAEFGFVSGNGEVLSTLKNVADQLKVIGIVAENEVQGAMGLHDEKQVR